LVDGALIERELEDMLRYALPLKRRKADKLFSDTNGILSTFASKIQMADALGLIGPETKGDIERVKEIRNIFAHAQRPVTFRNKRVAHICAVMAAPKRYPPNDPRWIRTPFGQFKLTTNILKFELAVRRHPGSDWQSP
jgi:hypothetical protein